VNASDRIDKVFHVFVMPFAALMNMLAGIVWIVMGVVIMGVVLILTGFAIVIHAVYSGRRRHWSRGTP
jgi:uncharacterized membrane protein